MTQRMKDLADHGAYANSVIANAREVASRTEHSRRPKPAVRLSDPHRRYWDMSTMVTPKATASA